MSSVIDGKAVAASVLEECRAEVQELKAKGITPGLAVVLVGDDPASHVYVGSKVRTCADLGLYSRKIELPAITTQEELLAVVRELNSDPAVHGILVQSPPPKHIDEEEVIRAIDPRKDVDGFHPENVAKLVLEDSSGFVPCTPAGCMRLLAASGVKTAGAEAVVIGAWATTEIGFLWFNVIGAAGVVLFGLAIDAVMPRRPPPPRVHARGCPGRTLPKTE